MNYAANMTRSSRGVTSWPRGRGRGRVFTSASGTSQSSPFTPTILSTPMTSQVGPPDQQFIMISNPNYVAPSFAPNNNPCRQEISNVIKSMYDNSWPSYTKIHAKTRERWFQKWAEKFIWDRKDDLVIRKIYDHRIAIRLQ
ncbi:hypothetical protein Ahy_A09g045359 [Arachis hypogaea]|uniref:Uncharacterized protein n=1 Tax=Arachis hypogaea TaxID=3818 RepID=A0A445BM57_ARAHY|nr:hypothetical protein Ahy_A09g045359 [Arachis hypogaea]